MWGSGALLVGLVASVVLSAMMRVLAPRLGLLDKPRLDRHHQKVTALGGGPAWFLAAILTMFGAFACLKLGYVPSTLHVHQPGLEEKMAPLALLGMGAFILMLMGLRDDLRPVPMVFKLAIECVLGVGVFFLVPDARVSAFLGDSWLVMPATVGWVMLWTNVFNLLDHADGMSASAGICVSLGLAWLSFCTGQIFVALLAMVLAGVLLGFLVHNFPPARLFMGDAGSLPLGFMMGSIMALHTFYDSDRSPWSVLTPLCLTLVPLYDVMSVMWLRFKEGRPLWLGDKRHLAHRLQSRGWGQSRVLLLLFLMGAVGGILAWGVGTWDYPRVLLPAILTPGFIVLLWSLERPQ